MQIRIGHERVIAESDNYCVFAVQIGVTRVGSGGRCMPRTRRGGMTTVAGLVASLVERIETERRPNPAVTAVAHLARAVVALAAWVLVQPIAVVGMVLRRLALRFLSNETVQLTALALGFAGFLACRHEVRAIFAIIFS